MKVTKDKDAELQEAAMAASHMLCATSLRESPHASLMVTSLVMSAEEGHEGGGGPRC